jgi:hypothetical protein
MVFLSGQNLHVDEPPVHGAGLPARLIVSDDSIMRVSAAPAVWFTPPRLTGYGETACDLLFVYAVFSANAWR